MRQRPLEAVRAVIVRGVLFGTAPKALAFAYGGKGRWLLWLPWRWAACGWILCGKDRALSGACPGAWELVEVRNAPKTVRRAYAEAARKWNAVRKDRWPA